MSDKTGHYRFDPYASIRNPFPTVGSTPGDVPEDLTYIRQSELDRLRNRLAQIERQVRELADAVDDPDHPYGNASGDEIRAVLDPPDRGDST